MEFLPTVLHVCIHRIAFRALRSPNLERSAGGPGLALFAAFRLVNSLVKLSLSPVLPFVSDRLPRGSQKE